MVNNVIIEGVVTYIHIKRDFINKNDEMDVILHNKNGNEGMIIVATGRPSDCYEGIKKEDHICVQGKLVRSGTGDVSIHFSKIELVLE